MQIDEHVEEILNEFKAQRVEIKDMVVEIERLREKMDLLFPESIDSRTRRFLEDKVKTMVAFYNVLLDMRKEISKSLKDEMEMRRRLTDDELDLEDIDELLDIGSLAKKVEKFQEQKVALQNKRLKEHRGINELEERGIEVPGLKELKEQEGDE